MWACNALHSKRELCPGLLWQLLPLQELSPPCPQGLGSLLGTGMPTWCYQQSQDLPLSLWGILV